MGFTELKVHLESQIDALIRKLFCLPQPAKIAAKIKGFMPAKTFTRPSCDLHASPLPGQKTLRLVTQILRDDALGGHCRMIRPQWRLILALGVAARSCANATIVIQSRFDQLVQQAEVIFQGTVSNVQSARLGEGADRHIFTYGTFAVEDSIPGGGGERGLACQLKSSGGS